MDVAVIVAALILNPIARRKRAAQASEPAQMIEATTVLTGDAGGSRSPEKSDPESGGVPSMGGTPTEVSGPRKGFAA
jgi:hypothetical protein